MEDKDIHAAVYGILQLELRERKMVADDGRPLKLKGMSQHDEDIMKIYTHFAELVREQSKQELNDRAKVFNSAAAKLHDDYNVNMMLLGLFIIDDWLVEQPKHIQLYLTPKIKRLSKYARSGLNMDIVKDSRIAASNIYRRMNGKAELTKEVRQARLNSWKKAAGSKSTSTSDR